MSSRLQSNQRLDYVVDTDQLFSNRSTSNDVVPKRRSSFDSEHAPLVDESELDDEQSLASRIDRVLGHNNDDNADFNNSNKVANNHSAGSMAGGHGGGVSDDSKCCNWYVCRQLCVISRVGVCDGLQLPFQRHKIPFIEKIVLFCV